MGAVCHIDPTAAQMLLAPTPNAMTANDRTTTNKNSAWRETLSHQEDFLDVLIYNRDYALVFWEVTGESVQQARERLGKLVPGAELVLRIRARQQTDEPARTLDVPLRTWIGEQLVLLGAPGAVHHFSLGLRAPSATELSRGGFFVTIAQGPSLCAPRTARAATSQDTVWETVPGAS